MKKTRNNLNKIVELILNKNVVKKTKGNKQIYKLKGNIVFFHKKINPYLTRHGKNKAKIKNTIDFFYDKIFTNF